MKTLMISVMLGLTVWMLNAQQVTKLNEARLFYTPQTAKMSQQGNSYVLKIPNAKNGQFAKDPIGFMNDNFNIHEFIKEVAHENYDFYEVTFQSSHGNLIANFNRHGDLLRTSEKFVNVALPAEIRNEIYSKYKGWTLVGTKYTSRTKGEILASANYKVHLQNGREKQDLKIDATHRGIGVALN